MEDMKGSFSSIRGWRDLRSGQMLIESLVAMSILTVGFLGIVGLLNQSVGLNKLSQQNFTASFLASEGVEIVKNILDHNAILKGSGSAIAWNDGIVTGTYEADLSSLSLSAVGTERHLYYSDTGGYQYDPTGSSTPYVRTIAIDSSIPNRIRVQSTVKYQSRGISFSTTVENYFYNWRF